MERFCTSNNLLGNTNIAGLERMLKFIQMSLAPAPPLSFKCGRKETWSHVNLTSMFFMPAVMLYSSSFKSYRNPWQWLLFSYLIFEKDRDIGKSRTHPISAWLHILSYLLTPFALAKSQCGTVPLKCHPTQGCSCVKGSPLDFWISVHVILF